MAVKTTRTATEEQLPTREEAEAAFALALDARQERVRAALNKLASDPPQVLILEGGSVAERFSVALWHAARLNCPEGRPPCLHCPACLQIGANLFHDLYVLDGREGSIKIETVRELRTILGEAPRGDGKRYKKFLKPGDAPEADFCIPVDKVVSAREYCNLHGLWKA